MAQTGEEKCPEDKQLPLEDVFLCGNLHLFPLMCEIQFAHDGDVRLVGKCDEMRRVYRRNLQIERLKSRVIIHSILYEHPCNPNSQCKCALEIKQNDDGAVK